MYHHGVLEYDPGVCHLSSTGNPVIGNPAVACQDMKRPNFFVVGAPKSGTTALCEYLSCHPNVFFSEPKELNYFCEDFNYHRMIRDQTAYESMFSDAGSMHIRVGEGSVLYLYSTVALERIRAFDPDARIIVMLRNPVDMIPALHQQFLAALYEDEPNVEKAWSLQNAREQGRNVPRLCRQPELLAYRKIGMLAVQIERMWTIFPREQTLVILFDDFVADTRKVYLQVLDFLGLQDDGRVDFPRINEAHALRTGLSGWLVRNTPVSIRNLMTRLRYTRVGRKIPALADKLLKRPQARDLLSPEFRLELVRAYEHDIAHLGALLGRDLSEWIRPQTYHKM